MRSRHTKILESGETVHDYRPDKLGWGWNIIHWHVPEDRKSAEITGIGLGIKEGHFIAAHQNGSDVAFEVKSVKYESNPSDLYNAALGGTYDIEEGDLD